jgi:hypothetical protein
MIAILAVLGPFIAALPIFLALLWDAISRTPSDWAATLLIFERAYRWGWSYALMTGVIIAAWGIWSPPTFGVMIAATIAANVILSFAGPAVEAFIPIYAHRHPIGDQLVFFFSLFATTICWFIGRRFMRSP